MEAALIIIDTFIATKPVRWLLLVLTTTLLVVTGVSLVRQKALSLQLSAAKGDVAVYAASLGAQNAAIVKQGEAMQHMQKQSENARNEAARIRQAWQQREKQLNELKLVGDCPDMVQQVLAEVRK
jgi:hypothetical protein